MTEQTTIDGTSATPAGPTDLETPPELMYPEDRLVRGGRVSPQQ
jgi:hypothetical protein